MKGLFSKFVSLALCLLLGFDAEFKQAGLQTADLHPPVLNTSVLRPDDEAKDFSISPRLGIVQSRWIPNSPKENQSLRNVLVLQDAHVQYQAQKNIARIVKKAVRDYGVELVAVEGARGSLDVSALRRIKNSPYKEKVIDHFLKEGVLTGPEALAICSSKDFPIHFWGIEKDSLYVQDLKDFRSVVTQVSSLSPQWKKMQEDVEALKKKVFSQRLFTFLKKADAFENGKGKLKRWAVFLEKYSVSEVKQTPNFKLLMAILDLEFSLDMTQAEKERQRLFQFFQEHLPKEELKDLVQESLLYRLKKISAFAYFSKLKSYGPDLLSYPSLEKLIQYLDLQNRLDSFALDREMKVLAVKARDSLFRNQEERDLYGLDLHLKNIDAMMHLKMSREDFYKFKKGKGFYEEEKLKTFFDEIKLLSERHAMPMVMADDFVRRVSLVLKRAQDFYTTAVQRDRALLNRLLKKMDAENVHQAMMVVGGFHADGIVKRLRKQGIAYVVITPQIKHLQSEEAYLRLMMGKDADLNALAQKFHLAPPHWVDPNERLVRELGLSNFSREVVAAIQNLLKGMPLEEGERRAIADLSREEKQRILEVLERHVRVLLEESGVSLEAIQAVEAPDVLSRFPKYLSLYPARDSLRSYLEVLTQAARKLLADVQMTASQSRNDRGDKMGIPSNDLSTRRSLSPVTMTSTEPVAAVSRTISSFGSRQDWILRIGRTIFERASRWTSISVRSAISNLLRMNGLSETLRNSWSSICEVTSLNSLLKSFSRIGAVAGRPIKELMRTLVSMTTLGTFFIQLLANFIADTLNLLFGNTMPGRTRTNFFQKDADARWLDRTLDFLEKVNLFRRGKRLNQALYGPQDSLRHTTPSIDTDHPRSKWSLSQGEGGGVGTRTDLSSGRIRTELLVCIFSAAVIFFAGLSMLRLSVPSPVVAAVDGSAPAAVLPAPRPGDKSGLKLYELWKWSKMRQELLRGQSLSGIQTQHSSIDFKGFEKLDRAFVDRMNQALQSLKARAPELYNNLTGVQLKVFELEGEKQERQLTFSFLPSFSFTTRVLQLQERSVDEVADDIQKTYRSVRSQIDFYHQQEGQSDRIPLDVPPSTPKEEGPVVIPQNWNPDLNPEEEKPVDIPQGSNSEGQTNDASAEAGGTRQTTASGNVASGFWPADQEEALHGTFGGLIGNTEQDVTGKAAEYEQDRYIRELIDVLAKAMEALNIEDGIVERVALDGDQKRTIENKTELQTALAVLLNNPKLKLFFLKPENGYENFAHLHEAESGREIPLHAEAHFGHHKTTGPGREENIYIASPAFDRKTEGERLELIAHEMVHLILGRGDEVHHLADQVGAAVRLQYDQTHFDLNETAEKIARYLKLKKDLFEAVKALDQPRAKEIYEEWAREVDEIAPGLQGISAGTLSLLLFAIVGDPDVDYRAIVIEIHELGVKEFSESVHAVIRESVDEMVSVLFDDEAQRDEWRAKMIAAVRNNALANFLPPEFFEPAVFQDEEKRMYLLAQLAQLSKTTQATGSHMPVSRAVHLSSRESLREIKITLKHEFIHWLATEDVMKIDAAWEFTTFASEIADRVIHFADGGVEAGERDFLLHAHQISEGTAAGKALYLKGKELYREKGDAVFQIALQRGGEGADYFSIDHWVEEAMKVYAGLGLPVGDFEVYLAFSRRPPQNMIEAEQYESVRYAVQNTIGILFAGVLVAQYEKTKVDPIRSLKNYFDQWHEVFGVQSREDSEWVDRQLIPKLQKFVGAVFGSTTAFEDSNKVDELGLWKYKVKDAFASAVEYWRLTLFPRKALEGVDPRKEAQERAFGHLLLAEYRAKYRPAGPEFERRHADDLKDEAFRSLWEFMLIPSSVYQGHTGITADSRFKGADYKGIPKNILNVFKSLFDFGNPSIERQVLSSYPLHLQYIYSILKMWSRFEGKPGEKFDDTGIEPGSELDQALAQTYENGWKPIFFDPAHLNEEELFEIVREEIYPTYKKLYDQAKKAEEEKKAKEEKEKVFPPQTGRQGQPGKGEATPQAPQVGGQVGQTGKSGKAGEGNKGEVTGDVGPLSAGSVAEGTGDQGQVTGDRGLVTGIDNSGLSQPGSKPSAVSQLEPPPRADSLSKILKGEAGQGTKYVRTKPAEKDQGGPTNADLERFDLERQLALTGLTAEELKVYLAWKRQLPDKLIRDTKAAFSQFLRKYLGQKFTATDDLSQTWVNVVDIIMAQGGTARIERRRPFPVKIAFVLDKSGSMGFLPERILWARLMMMLFMEVMIDINAEYEGLFQFERIIYDQAIQRIGGTFKDSQRIKLSSKARVVYDTLQAMDPDGWTDDRRAFATAIQETLKESEKSEDPGINIILAIGDGNFATNTVIADLLEKAERKGVYARVVSVGDEAANQDTVNTVGEKRAIIPKGGDFASLPGLCWNAFIDILEDVTGQSVREMAAYLNEKGHSEINPQLRRILQDVSGRDFYFLQGWKPQSQSEEGRVGTLLETLPWIEWDEIDTIFRKPGDKLFDISGLKSANGKPLFEAVKGEKNRYVFRSNITEEDFKNDEHEDALLDLFKKYKNQTAKRARYPDLLKKALNDLKNFAPDIENYSVVVVRNVDFSGHYSHKRGGRIYIPMSFLEMTDETPAFEEERVKDFLLHEYLRCLLERSRLPKPQLSDREKSILAELSGSDQTALSDHERVVDYMKGFDAENGKLDCGQSVFEKTESVYRQWPRRTGYRHFFYQREGDKDYLVYTRGHQEWRWERGAGKINVPEVVTVDDDDNERYILQMLQKLYSQGVEYTSYSADRQFYIRERPGGVVELNQCGPDGKFSDRPLAVFGESAETRDMPNLGGRLVYDRETKSVRLIKKSGNQEIDVFNLKIEDGRDIKENRVLVLKGEPGLGKDELIQAAAHLLGEEVWYLVGHEDATKQDIVCRRVLTERGSEYVYSALNYVQHNGGIVVISEGQYIQEEAFGALKQAIASGSHERLVENGELVRRLLSNHPRARLVITTNIKRRGIKIEGFNDQAVLDRFQSLSFVWKSPPDEVELQYRLAVDKLYKLRPDLKGEALEKEKERIWAIAKGLMDVTWPLRLGFMGYNPQEQAAMREDHFARWTQHLQDATFQIGRADASGKLVTPRSPAELPRRAPSPRVIQAILQFAIAYPKTWERSPASVIETFFNFEANKMDEQERKTQMAFIMNQFGNGKYSLDGHEIPFKDKNPVSVVLRESSFTWDDQGYLVVTPEPVRQPGDRHLERYWETVRIRVPKSARNQLPAEIKKWLSAGNAKNMALLYKILQLRSLSMNLMLIGPQGSGKSILGSGVAKLLSGPELESAQMTPETRLSDLIQTPELKKVDGQDVVYYQYGPVARAAMHDKIVFLDELTQARPGVQAGLNEALQRRMVALYERMIQAGEGFGFIFAANTPGGPFKVEAPSDEFIERCAILRVDPLPTEEIYDFFAEMKGARGQQVNPNVLGKKKVDASGQAEKVLVEGKEEDHYLGLLGVYQFLRKYAADHPDDPILKRVPGFRVLEVLIPNIYDYWRDPMTPQERAEPQFYQKQLFDLFKSAFEQQAKDSERLHEIESLLKNAFKESGFWSDTAGEDGVVKYLQGEDMVITKLPLIRKSKTGEEKLDRALDYLQQVTRGRGVERFISEVDHAVDTMLLDHERWLALHWSEKLENLYRFREIWQVLHLITTERGKGQGLRQHLPKNFDAMKRVMEKIQAKIIIEEEWPPSFFLYKSAKEDVQTYEEAWNELKAKRPDFSSYGDLGMDDLLMKLGINQDDMGYVRSVIEKIQARLKPDLEAIQEKGKPLHEIAPSLFVLNRLVFLLARVSGKGKAGSEFYQAMTEMITVLEARIDAGPLPEAKRQEMVNDRALDNAFQEWLRSVQTLEVIRSHVLPGTILYEGVLAILMRPADDEGRKALLDHLLKNSDQLNQSYLWMISSGLGSALLKTDAQISFDYAEKLYKIWQIVEEYRLSLADKAAQAPWVEALKRWAAEMEASLSAGSEKAAQAIQLKPGEAPSSRVPAEAKKIEWSTVTKDVPAYDSFAKFQAIAPDAQGITSHHGSVYGVAFSVDRRHFVTGGKDGMVRVWHQQSGRWECQQTLSRHSGPVWAVAWAPDGRQFVSASDDKTLIIWKWNETQRQWEHKQTLTGHTDVVRSAAWSLDGQRIISGGADKTVRIWKVNAESGEFREEISLKGAADGFCSAAISPSGDEIIGGDWAGKLWVWKLNHASQAWDLHQTLEGHTTRMVNGIAFSPDGRRFVSVSGDNSLLVWAKKSDGTWEFKGPSPTHDSQVLGVTWAPDGERFISCSNDKTLRIWQWDASANRWKVQQEIGGNEGAVASVSWSQDGETILFGNLGGKITLWKASGPRRQQTVQTWGWMEMQEKRFASYEQERTLIGVRLKQISPDGRFFYKTEATSALIGIWNAQAGLIPEKLFAVGDRQGVDVAVWAFAPDGTSVAAGDVSGGVRVWRLQSGRPSGDPIVLADPDIREEHRGRAHDGKIIYAAYSLDGDKIITIDFYQYSSADRSITLKIWDAKTGKRLKRYNSGIFTSTDPADHFFVVSPDASHYAIVDRAWVNIGKLGESDLRAVPEDEALGRPLKIIKAQFSRDGKRFVTLNEKGTAGLINAETGESIVEIRGKNKTIDFAIFPDGSKVLTSDDVGTVLMHDVRQQKFKMLQDPTGRACKVIFSGDGHEAAAYDSGDLKTLKIWDARDGKEIESRTFEKKINGVSYSSDGSRIFVELEGPETIILKKRSDSAGTVVSSSPAEPAQKTSLQNDVAVAAALTDLCLELFGEEGLREGWRGFLKALESSAAPQSSVVSPAGSERTDISDESDIMQAAPRAEYGQVIDVKPNRPNRFFVVSAPDGRKEISIDVSKRHVMVRDVGGYSLVNMTESLSLSEKEIFDQIVFLQNHQMITVSTVENSNRRAVRLWDLNTGVLQQLNIEQAVGTTFGTNALTSSIESEFSALFVSGDGRYAVIALSSGALRILDTVGKTVKSLKAADTEINAHPTVVTNVVFSPDGKKAATVSAAYQDNGFWRGSIVKVWDTQSGHLLNVLDDQNSPSRPVTHGSPVSQMVFSKDGSKLITTGANDQNTIVWHLDLAVHTKLLGIQAREIKFSSNGLWALICGLVGAGGSTAAHGIVYVYEFENATYKTFSLPQPSNASSSAGSASPSIHLSSDSHAFFSPHHSSCVILWDENDPNARIFVWNHIKNEIEQTLMEGDTGEVMDYVTQWREGTLEQEAQDTQDVRADDGPTAPEKKGNGDHAQPDHLFAQALGDALARSLGTAESRAALLKFLQRIFGNEETGFREEIVSPVPASAESSADAVGTPAQMADPSEKTAESPVFGPVTKTVTFHSRFISERPLNGHTGWVSSAAWSPDGQGIVSGSWDKTLQVWEKDESGEWKSVELTGHTDVVASVAWSPDGQGIVSGSWDKTLRVWEKDESGQWKSIILNGHTDAVRSVAWSPDGKRIVSGSCDKTLRIWEKDESGEWKSVELAGHTKEVNSVAWSPDGERIVSGSVDKTLRVWEKESGQWKSVVLNGHTDAVRSAAWSPDGKRIVSGSDDYALRIWEKDESSQWKSIELTGPISAVNSVAWSPDGRRILSGSNGGNLHVWHKKKREWSNSVLESHTDRVSSAAWSADGKRIVSGSYDNTLRVWEGQGKAMPRKIQTWGWRKENVTADGEPQPSAVVLAGPAGALAQTADLAKKTVESHASIQEEISPLAYSPDWKSVVSRSSDNTLRVWTKNAQGKWVGSEPLSGHTEEVFVVSWAVDGKSFVSGSRDNTLRVWTKNAQGKWVSSEPLSGHTSWVFSISWSPDGNSIVSGSDREMLVWTKDIQGKWISSKPLMEHMQRVTVVSWSPDGKSIVSGSRDKSLRVWTKDDQGEWVSSAPLCGHKNWIYAVSWSPDGKSIASGSSDKILCVWEKDDQGKWECSSSLSAHTSWVTAISWSPDGKSIVSGSKDETLRVWTKDDRGEWAGSDPLSGHTIYVAAVSWSADGKRITSGDGSGGIRIWNRVEEGKEAQGWREEDVSAQTTTSEPAKSAASTEIHAPAHAQNFLSLLRPIFAVDASLRNHLQSYLDSPAPSSKAAGLPEAASVSPDKISVERSNFIEGIASLVIADGEISTRIPLIDPALSGGRAHLKWSDGSFLVSADGKKIITWGPAVSYYEDNDASGQPVRTGPHYWGAAIKIWDAATGQLLHVLKDDQSKWEPFTPVAELHAHIDQTLHEQDGVAGSDAGAISLSPDGRILISNHWDDGWGFNAVIIWDVRMGELKRRFELRRPEGVMTDNLKLIVQYKGKELKAESHVSLADLEAIRNAINEIINTPLQPALVQPPVAADVGSKTETTRIASLSSFPEALHAALSELLSRDSRNVVRIEPAALNRILHLFWILMTVPQGSFLNDVLMELAGLLKENPAWDRFLEFLDRAVLFHESADPHFRAVIEAVYRAYFVDQLILEVEGLQRGDWTARVDKILKKLQDGETLSAEQKGLDGMMQALAETGRVDIAGKTARLLDRIIPPPACSPSASPEEVFASRIQAGGRIIPGRYGPNRGLAVAAIQRLVLEALILSSEPKAAKEGKPVGPSRTAETTSDPFALLPARSEILPQADRRVLVETSA